MTTASERPRLTLVPAGRRCVWCRRPLTVGIGFWETCLTNGLQVDFCEDCYLEHLRTSDG